MWPQPLPGAPGAVLADPGMDSEGWFAVNGWKYLVKWHHSGSYQLCPGKSLWSAPCRGWRGPADRAGSRYVCGGGGEAHRQAAVKPIA